MEYHTKDLCTYLSHSSAADDDVFTTSKSEIWNSYEWIDQATTDTILNETQEAPLWRSTKNKNGWCCDEQIG